MARVVMKSGWEQRLLADRGIHNGISDVAEKIQARAAQINSVEAVDTGLMTASWRVTEVHSGRTFFCRMHNTARSETGFNYPLALEWGNSRVRAYHIAMRSIDAART